MKLKLTQHAIDRFKERITPDVDEYFISSFVSSELSTADHLYSCNGKDYFQSAEITFVVINGSLITLFLS